MDLLFRLILSVFIGTGFSFFIEYLHCQSLQTIVPNRCYDGTSILFETFIVSVISFVTLLFIGKLSPKSGNAKEMGLKSTWLILAITTIVLIGGWLAIQALQGFFSD